MTTADTRVTNTARSRSGFGRGIVRVLRTTLEALALAWAVLAVYYSNLPWSWLRFALAVGVASFGVWALWVRRGPRSPWAFWIVFLLTLAWFSLISPSHDRPWRKEVAVMPTATVEGDRVRLIDVRNFTYRARDDFDVRYEEREVSLAHLTSIDFFISYWTAGPIGHTFLSFNFDNAPPVSISIETRPEIGEGYSPIASLFKQYELIYVVGDERDIVRVRTNHRDEEVFRYRILTSPENARRLFLVYLDRVNELAVRPEFYHLLSNSCTVNIVRYANASGREGGFDVRHLLNGLIDRYFYDTRLIDTSLPFAELRRRAKINEQARQAGDAPDFAERIRGPALSAR
jgi:hypothetical protein